MEIPEKHRKSVLEKLQAPANVWMATVRPDGRPHLAPVWFVYEDAMLYVCIAPGSVKARNLAADPRVVLALEDGSHPVICEGEAGVVSQPWPEAVVAGFKVRYDWDITAERHYTQLLAVRPEKWLVW